MKDYELKGHMVYVDNFYTSIKLAKDLLARGIQVTGTMRKDRKGIPDFVKKAKLKRGESIFAKKKSLLIQHWRDKRDIYMLLTRHGVSFQQVRNRFGKMVLKPKAIVEYNNMGGVDKSDQLLSYYTSPRKTMRWQLKVFLHFVDLCLWNATFLYNYDYSADEKITYLDFRDVIISTFLKSKSTPTSTTTPTPKRSHFPKKLDKQICC